MANIDIRNIELKINVDNSLKEKVNQESTRARAAAIESGVKAESDMKVKGIQNFNIDEKYDNIKPEELRDRVNLLDKDVAEEMDTYKWGKFKIGLPKVYTYKDGKETPIPDPKETFTATGIKSLFSNISAIYGDEGYRDITNMPLHDSAEIRERIRKRTACTVKDLVEASQNGDMGVAMYNYSDFMYCKYLGRVPNNYLITLRRFPLPAADHILKYRSDEPDFLFPDMGRMVTWMGTPGNDMSNILKYTTKLAWQNQEAPHRQEGSPAGGDVGGGKLGQLLSGLDGSYGRTLAKTRGYGISGDTNWFAEKVGFTSGEMSANMDLRDDNHIWGNEQNLITHTKVPGYGLEFEQNITLTFDYELRSYNGINGRAAMADLLANILVVTYLEGKFFPGSYRSLGYTNSSLYSNLAIFKMSGDEMKDINKVFEYAWTSIKQIATGLGFTKGTDFKSTFANTKQAISNLAGNIMQLAVSGTINKLGRQQLMAFNSLISPQPTGQWHLTVGNPRNPILSTGNLILTSTEIEHYGPLGIDDFPTGLKVTVQLEPGKPRDSIAIEDMYTGGQYRIYADMGENIQELYVKHIIKGAKQHKSKNTNNVSHSGANTSDISAATIANEETNSPGSTGKAIESFRKFFGTNSVTAITTTAKGVTGIIKDSSSSESSK